MDVAQTRGLSRVARTLLLALLAGVAIAFLSLLVSTSSASAVEKDQHGSGLLGLVGQTADAAGGVLSGTTGAVDQVATGVVSTVLPAAEPVVELVPAPVAEPVSYVLDGVADTADDVVAGANDVLAETVDTTTGIAADVAGAGTVSTVTAPVVGLVTGLPVVGDVVGATGLDAAVTGIAGGLDATVSSVVGTAPATGEILPELPLTVVGTITDALSPASQVSPGTSGPGSPGSLPPLHPASADPAPPVAADATAAIVEPQPPAVPTGPPRASLLEGSTASTTDDAPAPPSGTPIPSGTAGGSGSAAGAHGGSTATAALGHEDAHSSPLDPTGSRTAIDDDLPGAPVFDTDSSPD